jgi:hypothetical protein
MSRASHPDSSSRRPRERAQVLLLAGCVVLLFWPAGLRAQDRVRLRNTKVVTGKALSLDEDGVRWEGKQPPLGWDEIESGTVGINQAQFDKLLRELGDHLYRLRLRLRAGEYRDILPHAEALFPRYASRRSATAYMVCQGLMWSRIAHGRREAALEPYLLCLDALVRDKKQTVVLPRAATSCSKSWWAATATNHRPETPT